MHSRRSVIAAGTMLGGLLGAAPAAMAKTRAEKAAVGGLTFTVPQGPWTSLGNIRRGGGQLHYAELGPKDGAGLPPVIVLHKLGGWLSDWRFVAPTLAEGRRVIAFDLPGHGGSTWDGAPPYLQTLGESAAQIIGALDEMGIGQFDLLGTSLGGCVSVSIAAFWPERVRKLGILSSALGTRRTLAEIKAAVDDKQAGDLFNSRGHPVPTHPDRLRSTFGMVNAEQIAKDGWESRKAANAWIQPSERGVGITDIVGTLPRIQAPTLLAYGEHDKAYFKFRDAAEAALKNSVTKIIKNSGAFIIQDNPVDTAAMLKEWIA